ncbi:hypothetical protein MPSEU_000180800 [Mayamaea pseudoterrestris]|nr:hypothetical protein MPSEU_000180800 [Mayamaea pseudoterrestris]
MPMDSNCDHGYTRNDANDAANRYKCLLKRIIRTSRLDVTDPLLEMQMMEEASRSWKLMDSTLHGLLVSFVLNMVKPRDSVVVSSKATPSQLLNLAMVVLHIEEAYSTASLNKACQTTDLALSDLTCLRNICRFFYQRAPCSCFEDYK